MWREEQQSLSAAGLMMEQVDVFTPVLLGLTRKPSSYVYLAVAARWLSNRPLTTSLVSGSSEKSIL